MSEEVLLVSLV